MFTQVCELRSIGPGTCTYSAPAVPRMQAEDILEVTGPRFGPWWRQCKSHGRDASCPVCLAWCLV